QAAGEAAGVLQQLLLLAVHPAQEGKGHAGDVGHGLEGFLLAVPHVAGEGGEISRGRRGRGQPVKSIGDAGEEGEKIGHDTALVPDGGTFASHLKDTNPARGARAETFRLAGTIVKRCEMGRRLYSRGLISDQLETL